MTFAAIETRLNAAVLARLANCTVTLDGGEPVNGIFEEPSAQAFGYVEGGKPTVSCIESDVPGIKRGDPLTITKNEVATAYVVGGAPRPDGTGLTVIPLELNQ